MPPQAMFQYYAPGAVLHLSFYVLSAVIEENVFLREEEDVNGFIQVLANSEKPCVTLAWFY
jgi:hypothetical protein